MSKSFGQWWESVPSLVSSFLWSTEEKNENGVEDEKVSKTDKKIETVNVTLAKSEESKTDEKDETEEKMSEKETTETLKPNKSTLYNLLGKTNTATSHEVLEHPQEEKTEIPDEPKEKDRKIQKNKSTLYKIVSSQNITFKKPEEVELPNGENDEYQEIIENNQQPIENQHFETENRLSIAENALYYVEDDRKTKSSDDLLSSKKETETKKISVEMKNPARAKRSQSIIETPRPNSNPESFFAIRKTNSTEAKSDLGDLSSISFSFFEPGVHEEEEDKTRDFVYDTIDESRVSLDLSNQGYVPMNDNSSRDENPYSSPRNSINSKSQELVPDYVGPDPEAAKVEEEEELFYAASEIINRRPPTPYGKRKRETIRESDYEDLDIENEKLPDLPVRGDEGNNDDYADVDINDYCRHRDEHPKKLSINHKGKNVNLVKVRSKINRAWKSVKSWINEEKDGKETIYQKNPRPEIIEIVHETKSEKDVVEVESDVFDGNTEMDSPKCYLSSENINYLTGHRKDSTLSDSETYMDMSRTDLMENGGDLFSSFTLLRRRKDGTTAVSGFRKSRHFPEGQNGFEELRRYIKQGGDFCKELSVILQERSEAEAQYAKSLSKLSNKLLKTSKDAVGSVSEAWQRMGAEMEAESDIHRAFSTALSEEVVKPLRQLVDSQHRIRKNVEGVVDKTGKALSEWRQAEGKSKKQSFLCARENEKLQDAMLDVRNNRNTSTLHLHHHNNHKNLSDKETAKLDLKRKKAEESVKKADVEYYSFCVRAERSRLDWESAVTRGSHCFQALEEERLSCLKNLASCYLKHFRDIGPKLIQCSDRLLEPVECCDVTRDIQTVVTMKGSSQPSQEQLLPDFYAEHVTLAMNRDRRKQALVKLLQLIRQDLERERRGKQGVENLQRALQQTPNFGAEESQQNVDEKLHHMKSMLIYLEAARYKVQGALVELDGRTKPSHPLASHIQVTRDRQGLQQSILKVPQWARNEAMGNQSQPDSPDWTGREAGDGTSVQPDSDFDEFSSVGSDKDYQSSVYNVPIISECNSDNCPEQTQLGQCRALYDYSAKLYDELNLQIGDVIQIHDKQPDGWWLGELHGVVGIFPATYVEEIK